MQTCTIVYSVTQGSLFDVDLYWWLEGDVFTFGSPDFISCLNDTNSEPGTRVSFAAGFSDLERICEIPRYTFVALFQEGGVKVAAILCHLEYLEPDDEYVDIGSERVGV